MRKVFNRISIFLMVAVVLLGLVACGEKQRPIVNPVVAQGPYYVDDNELPSISLSANDTRGTISWDAGQVIQVGEKKYKWTFVPTDATKFKGTTGTISLTFVTRGGGASPSSVIINHENAQKVDLLALNASQIASIKDDLKIAYFHTSHGNQIIEGNYAINYLFETANDSTKDFSDAIVYDSYGANMYVDAGQKDSAIGNLGTDIGSLVTATKCFFGDAGERGDLLFEVGKDLDVNVVIWSWCGELSVFSEARVQQYLDDLNELENYYNGVNNSRKIAFVYMTGHLYNNAYYSARTDDTKETNTRNNKLIRDYCKNNSKILFDFEDIESYDPNGEYYGDVCNDTSLYWEGAVAEWWARNWELGKTENVDWVTLNTLRSYYADKNYEGLKPISVTGFSHVEYSTIVLSKAYAFWVLLSHLITVV